MVIQLNDGRWGSFEMKMGSNEFESAASNSINFSKNVDHHAMGDPSFSAILTATE